MPSDGLDKEAPLAKQPGRPRNFAIPDVVSDRLDKLLHALNEKGTLPYTVQRKDLIAALATFADEAVADLQQLMQRYGDATVRDALLRDEKDADVIELRAVRPGRRAS